MARREKGKAVAPPLEAPDAWTKIVTHPVSLLRSTLLLNADLALRLGTTAADAPRAALDRDRVARALESASVPCLLVVETLIGAGGQLSKDMLLSLLHVRFGWDAPAAMAALREAAAACLLVYASVGRVGSTDDAWYAFVFEEIAEQLAQATWGLSLPSIPSSLSDQKAPEARTTTETTQRDRIARLAACVHFGVRANKGGTAANRTSLKKLAIAVNKTDVELASEITNALVARILRTEGDLIVPDRDKLASLADGSLVWGNAAEGLDAWIPSDRWVSEESVLRAFVLTRRQPQRLPIWVLPWDYVAHGTPELIRARAALAHCSAHRAVVEGHTFLRRSPSRRSTGDGHVTPSMEVMLGPAAAPDVAMKIALMAEPVRFDKVLTFKLTPTSISAAVAQGLDANAMLETLACVGRHAVPENVRAMVEDWTRSARSARIRAVWSIELSSAETADIVARSLGNRVVARPSPMLLLVDQALTAPEVALAKLGVKSSLATSRAQEPEGAPAFTSRPHPARDLRPSAAWMAKVDKARKDGVQVALRSGLAPKLASSDAADTDEFEDFDEEDIPPDPFELLRRRGEAVMGDTQLRDFYFLAADLLEAMNPTLVEWIAGLEPSLRMDIFFLVEDLPLTLLTFAALNPEHQTELLREQATLQSLVLASEELIGRTGYCSAPGMLVLAALAHPEAQWACAAERRALMLDAPIVL